MAGTVIGAVKAGQLRRFYLIGGCDGAKSGRNYYTEFAEAVPKDCVILTLACGKYRRLNPIPGVNYRAASVQLLPARVVYHLRNHHYRIQGG